MLPLPFPLSPLSAFDAINSTAGPARQHEIILWANTQGNIPWPWKIDGERKTETEQSEAKKVKTHDGKTMRWGERRVIRRGRRWRRWREERKEKGGGGGGGEETRNSFQDLIHDFTFHPWVTDRCKHHEHAAWRCRSCVCVCHCLFQIHFYCSLYHETL